MQQGQIGAKGPGAALKRGPAGAGPQARQSLQVVFRAAGRRDVGGTGPEALLSLAGWKTGSNKKGAGKGPGT